MSKTSKERPIDYSFIHKKNRVYLLPDVIEHIGKLLNLNTYDFYNSDNHFDDWCDKKGYGQFDPDNKKRSHSNIWFLEYQDDINGEKARPPSISLIDVFSHIYPEIFPLYYNDNPEGTEVYVTINFLIENYKHNRHYKNDTDSLVVLCLEKMQKIYGNGIYFYYVRT